MELEEIVMFCEKKLAKYLKQIPIEEFPDILSKYYVSVFRSV